MFFNYHTNYHLNTIMSLYIMGLLNVILRNIDFISILISIEIILLSLNLNFIIISSLLNDINGFIFSLFLLILAAAEAAVGLTLLIVYNRFYSNLNFNFINNIIIKG